MKRRGGRRCVFEGMSVWTHHLKDIKYHDTFEPSGAPNGTVYRDGTLTQLHSFP